MNKLTVISAVVLLVGCGTDPLEAGREAIERQDWPEAVAKLRPASTAAGATEEVTKAYGAAIEGYGAKLHGTSATAADCDGALEALGAIPGFGADEAESALLSQALLCAARHRARSKQPAEAASVVIEGMKTVPGFSAGSPVLAKAIREPALVAARAGKVAEATALAQVLFGSGEAGLAVATLDLLVSAGASPEAIMQTLQGRAEKAPSSDAAVGLAAGFGVWHGQPDAAARWYDGIVQRATKEGGASGAKRGRYSKLRAAEAMRLSDAKAPPCEVLQKHVDLGVKASSIPVLSRAAVEGGALLAWVEGDKAPDQKIRALRIGFDGAKGSPVTISEKTVRAAKASPDDPMAAFAPKNRETALALQACGEGIELAARGAPEGAWIRAFLGPDGRVLSAPAMVPPLGETGRMPSEDVWWNVGCSHDRLVHIWLADTQLMRLAWFEGGEPMGDPTNVRLPGFAPWFVATGTDEEATLLVWVDILGQGRSQIIRLIIPEDRTVPTIEEGEAAGSIAAEPLVEGIDGRVEHMRLVPVGGRLALVYHPQQGDLGLRWVDPSGRALGQAATVLPMRDDAQEVRFDASGAGELLGIAWSEALTESWGALHFVSADSSGTLSSRPVRIAGLVRPTVPPLVVASADGRFVVAWVDRSHEDEERLSAAILRCGGR